MIITNTKGRRVVVRHRDENKKRQETVINDCYPYCFVKSQDSELIPNHEVMNKKHGFKGLYGERLTKLVFGHPSDVHKFKKEYSHIDTWEANIPFVNRALSDYTATNGPFKNYEHRVWYLDCEWHPENNKMRVIVVYDSFTEKEYVWFIDDGLTKPIETLHEYGDFSYETPAKAFKSEKDMLQHFVNHMKKQDPDIITGWFVVGADIRTLIERMRATGVNASEMSPHKTLGYRYGDWEQPIKGRNCIDLMLGFSKLWELKNGKLPSYKLGDVAEEVLGENKVELPDGHDTYYTDRPLYVHYCRQDVRLLPRLNEKVNALEYYSALQHLVQCSVESTPFITKMFSCLVLADEEFDRRIPTAPQFKRINYEGADVMQVNPGLYEDIAILDVKAMYHSNASMHNISWDTLDEDGVDCGNGTRFSSGKKGLLIRQMDYMTDLRNKFKKLMKSDPDNYDRWDTMQFACKSLVASMYGVCGDSKYGMYHPEVAAAITYTSRQTLDKLRRVADAYDLDTIYGHTDSIFVMGRPHDAMDDINREMAPIEVEFEKFCDRMVLMAKNRYAGMVSWENGEWLGDPKLYVKGIELKQSRMPPVMKDVMSNVISGILSGTEKTEVVDFVSDVIDRVINKDVDPLLLCMKGKLDKDLSSYKVLSGPSAGADWANKNIGKNYRSGSFFLVTLDENGKYMAFDNPSEIEGISNIGYRIMAERFIVKKVEPYFNIMSWPMRDINNALNGLSLRKWL